MATTVSTILEVYPKAVCCIKGSLLEGANQLNISATAYTGGVRPLIKIAFQE